MDIMDHNKALWCNDDVKADHSNMETDNFIIYKGDLITMDKIEDALGRTKNQKTTGHDGLNMVVV